jgi:hypothetical protein
LSPAVPAISVSQLAVTRMKCPLEKSNKLPGSFYFLRLHKDKGLFPNPPPTDQVRQQKPCLGMATIRSSKDNFPLTANPLSLSLRFCRKLTLKLTSALTSSLFPVAIDVFVWPELNS